MRELINHYMNSLRFISKAIAVATKTFKRRQNQKTSKLVYFLTYLDGHFLLLFMFYRLNKLVDRVDLI